MFETGLEENKSYVSFLYEVCAKKGYEAKYSVIFTAVNGKFECTLKVLDHEVTAIGCGKKKARQNAAAEMLKLLKEKEKVAINSPMENGNHDQEKEPASSGNPVGQLHLRFQRNQWTPPSYDFLEGRKGDVKVFVCSIKSPAHVVKGYGNSKRSSKRNAASAFLKLLDETPQEFQEKDISSEDNALLLTKIERTFNKLKKEAVIPSLLQAKARLLAKFYQDLKTKMGKTLACLHTMSLNDDATNFCQLLQEVAEEQDFELIYKEYVHKTYHGDFQCTVHLSSDLALFHGTGPTPAHAHKQAAHNALQYLKIMTRK